MPYTTDNPPTFAKNLPKGAISLCVSAFNAVVRDGGDEDTARKACWNNIKNKYKKVGDKWVPKESEMEFDYAIDADGTVCDETPWSQINKSTLPKSSFAYAPTDKKSDWKLPYKTADGKIHCGGVRAALQAIGGARTGKPMSVPASVKAKLQRAAKTCGIGKESTMEQLTETLFSPLELQEQDERGYYHANLLCTRGDYVNGNNRVYPMAIWEREVPRVKDLITQGRFIGLADHPGVFGSGASILNTVIKFDDLRIEGREVWGDVTIIPTSKGKDVIEIAKAGVQIGASTRGNGSLVHDRYTDPDGEEHEDVGIVDVDSYKFDAVDLVLQPSVGDAGMYRFEQLNDEDIEQLQEMLFAEIEERATEPLKQKVSELEDMLEAAGEDTAIVETDNHVLREQVKEMESDVAQHKNKVVEQEQKIGDLTASLAEANSQLQASNSRNAALTHLMEKVKGEKFALLLYEELKRCASKDEVDESFDAALSIVTTLVAGSPPPSGKAVITPQRTDLESEDQEQAWMEAHGLGEELTEEEKAQALRDKLIRVRAGLDMFEE